jgi:hypothetical protein
VIRVSATNAGVRRFTEGHLGKQAVVRVEIHGFALVRAVGGLLEARCIIARTPTETHAVDSETDGLRLAARNAPTATVMAVGNDLATRNLQPIQDVILFALRLDIVVDTNDRRIGAVRITRCGLVAQRSDFEILHTRRHRFDYRYVE